jgi:1-acyl-sn-glycerol-3-phosphate acyltransferase
MTAGLLAYVARAVSGASVRFVERLPDAGRRVYFGNHCSHLDFLVIWSSLPEAARSATRPVAAADYWRRGRLRRHLAENVFRAVLIDRAAGGQAAVELCDAALADGDSLIIFPEGTRGEGPDVGAFKSGLFHLASHWPGLELVPVHLENLNRVLPKGEAVPVPLMSRVTFGPAMTLGVEEEKAAFLERARRAVTELQ